MSDGDEGRRDLAFARWWDELLAGRSRRPPRDVDADLAAFARRIHAVSAAVPPPSAFRRHLWEELMHALLATAIPSATTPPPFGLDGTARDSTRYAPAPRRARAWCVRAALAACLLLLAAAAVALALRDDRPGTNRRAAVIQAPTVATPGPRTAPAGVASDLLVGVGFAPEELPAAPSGFGLSRATWDPGTSIVAERIANFEPGVAFHHVVAGTFTVTSGGPTRVTRAGSPDSPEEIAPGTELVLAPGDAVVYLDAAGSLRGPQRRQRAARRHRRRRPGRAGQRPGRGANPRRGGVDGSHHRRAAG